MRIKKTIALIELFAVTCVFSVGFSSWSIVANETKELSGNFIVEDVKNVSDYINVNSMIFTDYDSNGFYTDFIKTDANGPVSPTKKAALEIELEVDLYEFKDFGEYSELNFDFELTNITNGINIINLANDISMSYTYLVDSTTTSNQKPIDGYSYTNDGVRKDKMKITYDSSKISSSKLMWIVLRYEFDLTTNFSSFYNYVTENASTFEGLSFNLFISLGGN